MPVEAVTAHAPALTPEQTALLLGINRSLGGHRSREALCAALAEAVAGVLPADRVSVLTRGSAGVYAVADGRKLSEASVGEDGSAPAWVMANRRALVVASPEEIRERFPATHRQLVDAGVGSAAVLPLVVDDRVLGAVAFLARAERSWDGGATALLEEIATSFGLALDNSLAYEQLHGMGEELKALLDVSGAIGRHLGRDELFGALATCLRSLLTTDRFGIELPLEDDRLQGHFLTPQGASPQPTEPHVLPAAGTACAWVLRERQWIVFSTREDLRVRFPVTFEVMEREGMESLCALPLETGGRCRGVLFFMAAERAAYEGLRRGLLEQVASAVAVALDDCLAHEEVRHLRDQLAAENVYLQEEIRQDHGFDEMVGRSAALKRVLTAVEKAAPTDSTVLICGETGTGKELVARAVHAHSRRAGRPLIKVNCAAIPAGLVESELFGHEKGAFTGATARRTGRFELADGGTIFLDETGELPLDVQVKLLRVLQEREFERVGGTRTLRVDVRVIAATNRDLAKAVAAGTFRQDLYYRLNVFPVEVPPLRERADDIPLLVHCFVERYGAKIGRKATRVPRNVMARLTSYPWPGNVRELENVIERAVILSTGPDLEVAPELLPASRTSHTPAIPLEQVERTHIVSVLKHTGWRIDGPQGAARILELNPSTLRSRMQKLGIQRSAEGDG